MVKTDLRERQNGQAKLAKWTGSSVDMRAHEVYLKGRRLVY